MWNQYKTGNITFEADDGWLTIVQDNLLVAFVQDNPVFQFACHPLMRQRGGEIFVFAHHG